MKTNNIHIHSSSHYLLINSKYSEGTGDLYNIMTSYNWVSGRNLVSTGYDYDYRRGKLERIHRDLEERTEQNWWIACALFWLSACILNCGYVNSSQGPCIIFRKSSPSRILLRVSIEKESLKVFIIKLYFHYLF